MSFGKNPTTTTQTTLANNQFPLSTVAVPNHAGGDLTALRGANASTDSNNNETADASMYIPDGNNVAQGSQADAAVTNPALSATEIALIKGLLTRLNTLVTNSPALGQAAMTASAPVVIANNQSAVPVSGTVGVNNFPATQAVSGTVTANVGTTNGLALDTSVNGVIVTQGSTTSGEKGPLVQGAVTTGAPAYTNGQTSPISLTPVGAVRTDATATTQPVSGTITANAGSGNFTVAQATAANLNAMATIQAVTGTSLAADQTNSELRVSNYVKTTTAGDTALALGQSTKVGSLPVTLASDQGAVATTDTNSAAMKTDLDTVVTNTTGLATQTTLASVLTQVTNHAVTQGTGAAAGTNWRIAGDFNDTAGQAAGSVTGTSTDLFPSMDMSSYSFAILQLTGTWSMTLQAQWSNDNFATVPVSGEMLSIASATGLTFAGVTTNGMYMIPKKGRYLRIRPSVFTSNASCVGALHACTTNPPTLTGTFSSSQSGTWTVQPGNTPNTTPWLVTQSNNNASVPTGAGNTVIKAAAGSIATLVVTTAGTGAGNVQIFDNASTNSGTVLFAFPATVSVAQFYQISGWAKVGMTAQNVLNGPVFTVYYS